MKQIGPMINKSSLILQLKMIGICLKGFKHQISIKAKSRFDLKFCRLIIYCHMFMLSLWILYMHKRFYLLVMANKRLDNSVIVSICNIY
jgi:hypothetical protein